MVTSKANADIREFAKSHSVKLWEIADALGIYDGNLSRMLRKELAEEKKQQIMSIIEDLAKERMCV